MLTEAYITELYKQKFDKLCSYAYMLTADHEISRDIVQDVFIDFFEHMESLQHIFNVDRYIVRSVKNRCYNHIKSRTVKDKYFSAIVERMALCTNNIVSELELTEIEDHITRIIDQLPELRGVIFKMSREDEKTYAQIAEELSISIKTVEAHISKALKFIKSNLEKAFLIITIIHLLLMFV